MRLPVVARCLSASATVRAAWPRVACHHGLLAPQTGPLRSSGRRARPRAVIARHVRAARRSRPSGQSIFDTLSASPKRALRHRGCSERLRLSVPLLLHLAVSAAMRDSRRVRRRSVCNAVRRCRLAPSVRQTPMPQDQLRLSAPRPKLAATRPKCLKHPMQKGQCRGQ